MHDDYTMTADDMPPAEEEESKFPAELLCKVWTGKVNSDSAEPRRLTLNEIWESTKVRNQLLGVLAPFCRSRETLQAIQDELERRIYLSPLIAHTTVLSDDPDIRYVPVYDSLTAGEGLQLVKDSDADLVVTVLRCPDGIWRFAGIGDPADPKDIPRQ